MDAAIVIVGDEILSGHVRDANGYFIALRLAAHGHRLRSITVVPDDPPDIAAAVRRSLGVHGIVFVCGGVGPTHDDRTMEGVAEAAGVALSPCEPIAERIELLAGRLAGEGIGGEPLGIEGLRKMALAPLGSEALLGSRGVIPAVALTAGETLVCVLPGPPRELEAVFTECVEPRYLEGTGEHVVREEIVHPFPESAVAAMLDGLARETPEVTIGSYPMPDHSLIRVSGPGHAVGPVAEQVRERLAAMTESDEGRRLLALWQARPARD